MSPRSMSGADTAGPRGQILQALAGLGDTDGAEGLTAAELGERLGLHPTTIRFHVNRLRVSGLVSQRDVRREGAGRPARKYTLAAPTALTSRAPGRASGAAFGIAPLTKEDPHELLAQVLVRAAGPNALTPAQAGRAWAGDHTGERSASWGEATARVAELLADWGYDVTLASEVEEGPAASVPSRGGREGEPGQASVEVTFTGCPFEALARSDTQVVCGIHHGLLEGSLAALGHPDAQVRLVPFATRSTCRARLTPTPQ